MAGTQLKPQAKQEVIHCATSDATVTTLWSWTVPDDTVTTVKAEVVGNGPAGAGIIWEARATYSRVATGAPTLIGLMVTVNHKSVSTWLVAFDTSSNDVRVRVTGAAATTIQWQADVTVTVHA